MFFLTFISLFSLIFILLGLTLTIKVIFLMETGKNFK